MNQPTLPPADSLTERDRRIAELENELFRSYKLIKHLREEISDIKHQLVQSHQPTHSRHLQGGNFPQQPIAPFWISWLQFFSTIVGVAGLLGILGLIFLHPRSVQNQPSHETESPKAPEVSSFPNPPISVTQTGVSPNLPSLYQRLKKNKERVYNVKTPPNFKHNDNLQFIVDDIVNLARSKGLSTDTLSIYLIDVKRDTYAEYQGNVLRFPASVSKLFWMVGYYDRVFAGLQPDEPIQDFKHCKIDICKMVQKSDNEAASHILDRLTNTSSIQDDQPENFPTWKSKRLSINDFFQEAGYTNINVSQKNFPIPDIQMEEPQGRDLQMREDLRNPTRNKISVEQASRLMYEIMRREAISPKASETMIQLLRKYLNPEVWQNEQYNGIEGFFGESLAAEAVAFYTKVGWTQASRQEVAYIQSLDGSSDYILAVFGDSPDYGSDWRIFPEISNRVYNRMISENR